MSNEQQPKTPAERLAYERGYQAGVDSMFAHWCNLKSECFRLKSEVRRMQEIVEERMFG